MRNLIIFAVLGAVLVATALLALGPESRRSGIAIIGDHAPSWASRIGLGAAAEAPAIQFVLVDGWRKMAFLGEEAVMCGGACTPEAILVRTVVWRLGDSHKQVVAELSGFDALGDGDPGSACLEAVLRAESAVLGPARLPDCVEALGEVRTQRLLPFGLGRI